VYNGTYYESVMINKGLQLIGVGNPLIHTTYSTVISSVTVTADGCSLNNFSLRTDGSLWGFRFFSSNNSISNCSVLESTRDLDLVSSSNNRISHNNFHGGWIGLVLTDSCNNTITCNSVCSHVYGEIRIEDGSHYNNVSNNECSNSDITEGIVNEGGSSHNIIQGNKVSSNRHGGILIDSGENLTIVDNILINNSLKLNVPMNMVQNYTIDNNTVNGKPIIVYINKQALTIPSDAGQVLLFNCSYCHIMNLTISEVDPGIRLESCSNNIISDNQISSSTGVGNAGYGITLSNSHKNIVSKNNVTHYFTDINIAYSNNNTIDGNNIGFGGDDGIYAWYAMNNTFSNNTISSLGGDGMYLYGCKNSLISSNIISSSKYGIYIYYASNNIITENSISETTYGIDFLDCTYFTVTKNNVSWNSEVGMSIRNSNIFSLSENTFYHNMKTGLDISRSHLISVIKNNFIGNKPNAFFANDFLTKWKQNYWDNYLGIGAKKIIGVFGIVIPNPNPFEDDIVIVLPWINFDRFPARSPYDFPGRR
jgi:parallel beta-helix repeat protein